MKEIPAGAHTVKVEINELWSSGEKLSEAFRELKVDYVSQTQN
jgi:hypothetical protein